MPLRKFFQRLAPTLSAYLLLVSLGFPLQRVYCACVGEHWVSLPTEVHECRHAKAEKSHHPNDKPSCCQLRKASSDHHSAQSKHDCGDTSILLAQLDTDFIWEQDELSPLLTVITETPSAISPWASTRLA
ncbi:MAG: hypothetical protein AAGA62_09355, partial [Bacteroidota bacterium]